MIGIGCYLDGRRSRYGHSGSAAEQLELTAVDQLARAVDLNRVAIEVLTLVLDGQHRVISVVLEVVADAVLVDVYVLHPANSFVRTGHSDTHTFVWRARPLGKRNSGPVKLRSLNTM